MEKQLDKPIPSLKNQTTSTRHRRKTRSKKTAELVETPAAPEVIPAEPNWCNIVVPNSILDETTKDWVKNLWEKVKEVNDMRKEKEKAPLEEINLDKGQVDVDVGSRYESASMASKETRASYMKVLPSFLGDYNSDKDVLKPQFLYHPNPKILGTSGKQNSKSSFEQEVAKGQSKSSLVLTNEIPLDDPSMSKATKGVTFEPIPINKVGEYCEGGEGNTTLPIECKGVKALAILDNGAGVAIATKKIWEAWGKPTLRRTRLKLQLAYGFKESPLGLLKKMVVTYCRIEYKHTFDVVNFGNQSNFEILLGIPFM